VRDGTAVYAVELDGEVLDMLVRFGWVLEAEIGNRHKVARAVAAMLADAAND
jgi:hypothetical protein